MFILNSFLGVQPPKTRMNKGFLNGGGGGKRLKPTRKLAFLTTNQNNKFLVQTAQNLNQNNAVSARQFAFTYNNLITNFQGVFRNADFSFYLRL